MGARYAQKGVPTASIEEILRTVPSRVEQASWYGMQEKSEEHFVTDSGIQLDFRGSTIELSYENYGTTCDIYENGSLLFGLDSHCTGDYSVETYALPSSRFDSLSDTLAYLKETYGGMAFTETDTFFSEKKQNPAPDRDDGGLFAREVKDMQAGCSKLSETAAKDTVRLQETEKSTPDNVAI